MKKFLNDVNELLFESLSGLAAAHADILRVEFEPAFVARARPAIVPRRESSACAARAAVRVA